MNNKLILKTFTKEIKIYLFLGRSNNTIKILRQLMVMSSLSDDQLLSQKNKYAYILKRFLTEVSGDLAFYVKNQ